MPRGRHSPLYAEGHEASSCGWAFVEGYPCPQAYGADKKAAWVDGRPVAKWLGPKTILLDCSAVEERYNAPEDTAYDRRQMVRAIGSAARNNKVDVVCARFGVEGHPDDWDRPGWASTYQHSTVSNPRVRVTRRRPLRPKDVDLSEEIEQEIWDIEEFERVGGSMSPETESRVKALWSQREFLVEDRKRKMKENVRWSRVAAPLLREWEEEQWDRRLYSPYADFFDFLAQRGVSPDPPHPDVSHDQAFKAQSWWSAWNHLLWVARSR